MKILLLLFLMLVFIDINAQQNMDGNYPIKEYYDQVLEPYFESEEYMFYINSSKPWIYAWGDLLLSYIRMYEATKDIAYLNKFIIHSVGIQMQRGEENATWMHIIQETVSESKYWNSNNVLYTGRLIRPMAEAVYLIKMEDILRNRMLPQAIKFYMGSNNIFTYGDFADWLESRVIQSLDYMNKYHWIPNGFGYSKDLNPKTNDNPIEINFNASYAVTMMLIASVNSAKFVDYFLKFREILNHFKFDLYFQMQNDNNQQRFVWYHLPNKSYKEDIGHAVFDIHITLFAHKLFGTNFFLDDDMNILAHTFTYNIWDRDLKQFNNTVFGTINGGTEEKSCGDIYSSIKDTNFYGSGEILGWMPLYKYDDADAYPNDIYTILLKQATDIINNNPNTLRTACGRDYAITGTTALFGLTEVIKAQWEKEDFSLRLFNRDLNYDQDFCAKKKLIVEPEVTIENNYNPGIKRDGSFADPSFKEKKFIVRSGNTVNMTAGESITFLPGTVIEAGSNFSASIAPDGCPEQKPSKSEKNPTIFSDAELDSLMKEVAILLKEDSMQMLMASDTMQKQAVLPAVKSDQLQQEAMLLPFSVYPNPVQSAITLTLPLHEQTPMQIILYDYTGRVLFTQQVHYSNSMQIQTDNMAAGLYYLHITAKENEFREVLVKR